MLGTLAAGGGQPGPLLLRDSAPSRAAARRADAPHPTAARTPPQRTEVHALRELAGPVVTRQVRRSPNERSQPRGRNAAHCPGWPLQRQGHPKIVSNRFAETISRTHP